ncbi:hypothetical protein D4Q76_01115 [archaeon]|nr:MAG: hypothetical protein D4Q76_01115 [archaeon]
MVIFYMISVSDLKIEEEARKTRLVLCPKCDSEMRVGLMNDSAECEECGEDIEVVEEGYPEEFIWHPNRSY